MIRFALSILGYISTVATIALWYRSDRIKSGMIDRRDRRLNDLYKENDFLTEKCKNQQITIGVLKRDNDALRRRLEVMDDDGK